MICDTTHKLRTENGSSNCRSSDFRISIGCPISYASVTEVAQTGQFIAECLVLQNTKHFFVMSKFGETVRQLREAQNLGLREAASMVGISPAYLSRIERGKEHPPKPEVIKALARVLAADPDVLFRLCPSTDPDIVSLLKSRPKVLELLRLVMEKGLTDEQIDYVEHFIDQDLLQRMAENGVKDGALCSTSP